MLKSTHHIFLAAWLTLETTLCASAAEPISQTINATPESVARSHEVDTATIRHHKLRHFEVKLILDPKDLHDTCRYESDISSAPPHKRLALTFDDGPEPVQTEFILSVLKRHGVKATFFMIGEQVKKHPELVEKVIADGHHLVANHSWDHPNFHSIDATNQAKQVDETELVLTQFTSKKLFRYPYGNSSCETNDHLRKQGYKIVGWHIDSCDWAFDKNGAVDAKEAATCGVLPQFHSDYVGHVMSAIRAHNGGIILMHEIHPKTLKKLDEIIQAALADGYAFDSIDAAEFESSLR